MITFESIDALLGRFYSAVGTAVGLAIGLFAIAISLDLLLRQFGIGNLPGLQEIIEYLLFTGVFIAAPWVLRLGSHVRVDLVISGLPKATARVLDRILDLFGLTVCLVLVWFGMINLENAYDLGALQMKYFNVPEWWFLTVFVASFAMLVFEFLSRFLRGGNAPEARREDRRGL